MPDRREEILNQEHDRLVDDRGLPKDGGELVFSYKPAAISAMDEYMKEVCLELLEYMAKSGYLCGEYKGEFYFQSRSSHEPLTKEQLFEDFL